jgi:hypothetical protein
MTIVEIERQIEDIRLKLKLRRKDANEVLINTSEFNRLCIEIRNLEIEHKEMSDKLRSYGGKNIS